MGIAVGEFVQAMGIGFVSEILKKECGKASRKGYLKRMFEKRVCMLSEKRGHFICRYKAGSAKSSLGFASETNNRNSHSYCLHLPSPSTAYPNMSWTLSCESSSSATIKNISLYGPQKTDDVPFFGNKTPLCVRGKSLMRLQGYCKL